jgi:hypothetical protein
MTSFDFALYGWLQLAPDQTPQNRALTLIIIVRTVLLWLIILRMIIFCFTVGPLDCWIIIGNLIPNYSRLGCSLINVFYQLPYISENFNDYASQ